VFNGSNEEDFMYCLSDNKEISVCREIGKSIGFPKLEDGLSILLKDELANSLAYNSIKVLSAFRDRGVPSGPTSEMSPRAPAQMGRRETKREGGKKATGARERERWKSCGLRVCPAPGSGALAVGGYKRPRGRGSERPHASACPILFPARPTLCKRALVLPFIGARRGSRCTMGV
jgi:hypothetical protein